MQPVLGFLLMLGFPVLTFLLMPVPTFLLMPAPMSWSVLSEPEYSGSESESGEMSLILISRTPLLCINSSRLLSA